MASSPKGKAKKYDQTKSKTRDESYDKWLSDQADLFDATSVPGIGSVTAQKLGVKTAYQLMARYLQKIGPGNAEDKFKQELHEAGVQAAWQDTVVEAVSEKLKLGHWEAPFEISEDIRSRSRLDATKLDDFTTKTLTGNLTEDLNGVGLRSADKLLKKNISNTFQLFGRCLEFETAEDLESEFKDTLTSAFRAQVIEQLCERLKNGSVVPNQMDEETSFDEEPPPPTSRQRNLSPPPAREQFKSKAKRIERAGSAPGTVAGPSPMPSNLPMMIAGILLAMFILKFVF
jgi:hypothetical protein